MATCPQCSMPLALWYKGQATVLLQPCIVETKRKRLCWLSLYCIFHTLILIRYVYEQQNSKFTSYKTPNAISCFRFHIYCVLTPKAINTMENGLFSAMILRLTQNRSQKQSFNGISIPCCFFSAEWKEHSVYLNKGCNYLGASRLFSALQKNNRLSLLHNLFLNHATSEARVFWGCHSSAIKARLTLNLEPRSSFEFSRIC